MLANPSDYFSSASRLAELESEIANVAVLDDTDAVLILKALIAQYGIDATASTAILSQILTRNPSGFLHSTENVPLLEQIEATLFILPQSSSIEAFKVLANGYLQNTALYPLLGGFKARLFAAASKKSEVCLRTLLLLPLNKFEICKVCGIAREHPIFSPATARAGLTVGPEWSQVCFESLHKWSYENMDDMEVARLLLELLQVLVDRKIRLESGGLLNKRAPDFGRCIFSAAVYDSLSEFLETGNFPRCQLPPLLDDLQTEISIAIASAPFEGSIQSSKLFPEFLETQMMKENIVEKFEKFSHEEMYSILKRINVLFKTSSTPSSSHPEFPDDWTKIFEVVLTTQGLLVDSDLRMTACSALTRALSFWQPTFTLQHDNVIGSWLIGCLRSSNRQLRLQATKCVGSFVTAKLPQEARFSQFRFLSGWAPDEQPETCLLVWAEAAVYGTDSEHLNVLLVRMLSMLGSQKPLVGGLAFHTFKQVARRRRETPWKLCMPFWDTIAVWIVRKLGTHEDSMVWKFCELLGVTLDDFLGRTSQYTVPYLTFRKRISTLKLIASAKSQSLSTLLWEHQIPITATFLTTDTTEDPDQFTERRWHELGQGFTSEVVRNMLQQSHAEMFLLLLMKAPEKNDPKANVKEERLLRVLSMLTGRESNDPLTSAIINKVIHRFSGTMHNMYGPTSLKNRQECLRGLDFLIRHSGGKFLSMIIPINTLVLSALEVTSQSQQLALSVWHTMIGCMEDCTRVIDLVYSVISQMWGSFDQDARKEAQDILVMIQNNPHTQEYGREHGVPLVPSLSPRRLFDDNKHETTILKELVARTEKENVYVVRQAVQEIAEFVHQNQNQLHMSLHYPQGIERIQTAIRALFDLSRRFPDPQMNISTPCIQALCFLGALDPNMVDIQRIDRVPVVVSNFDESQECREFAAYFAANYLFKMAEASMNPIEQNFLLYGIQDTLKFCELVAEDIDTPAFKATWDKLFGPGLYEQLTPFLYTRYSSPPVKLSRVTYPVFNERIEYQNWVGKLCYDLMCRTHGVNVDELFGLYRRIFVEQVNTNPTVFEFLLPYVALHAIMYSQENLELFMLEIKQVMWKPSTELDNVSQFHERIFAVLDYFARWKQAKRQQSNLSASDQRAISTLSQLENQISLEQLASRANECKSYPRELRYLDQLTRQNGEDKQSDYYEKMRTIYKNLGDSDALEGMAALKSEISFDEQIELYESKGDWSAALACYDAMPQPSNELPRLRCLHNVGKDREIIALLDDQDRYTPDLAALGVAASLRIMEVRSLSKYVNECAGDSDILEAYFGKCLIALSNKEFDLCMRYLEAGIKAAGARLNGTEITSLAKIRSTSLYLHAAADISQVAAWMRNDTMPSIREVNEFNDQRLLPLGDDMDARKYVLSIRRAAYLFAGFPRSQINRIDLEIAKDYRKRDQVNMALTSIWQAQHNIAEVPKAWTKEMAKLLWQQGERQRAISLLETRIDVSFLRKQPSFSPMRKTEDLKLALLYTTWLDQSGQVVAKSLYTKYVAILKENPGWEKAIYRFYKYYDRIYQSQFELPESVRSKDFWTGNWTRQMVQLCSKTLIAGSKYFSEILPKLLTLWLDFADNIPLSTTAFDSRVLKEYNLERQRNFKSISSYISKRALEIDPHILYHGVPQLMSRITTAESATFKIMKLLIVQVIQAFPEHALWMIAEATQSTSTNRKQRGDDIVKTLISETGRTRQIIPQALMTISKLKDLALYQKGNGKQRLPPVLQLSQIEFDTSWLPSPLVVPVHRILSCDALYTQRIAKIRGNAHLKLLRFSGTVVMYKVENEVAVQPSLQQPKRITVWGSDGQRYHLLCKGRDDVRKDARLIELSVTVNRLLDSDREAAERHLRIEPYRVIPLSADSGIIEWVTGAVPQRTIIEGNLRARGIKLDMKQVGSLLSHNLSPEARLNNFLSLQQKYPPVLYEWFLYTFSDPESWIKARTLYSRSSAVMSMVGYILGLGDRHNENLLILQSTGGQMHVDFECLFDKALSLTVPERVPFRLTRNMVDAFGVYGYEGPFRRTSEVTLGILRSHEELVMTVLQTFLYDPVVMRDEEGGPKNTLATVRDKLRGIRSNDSPGLSVAGHVDSLIQQAVSPENLSLMYCGWAAFL